MFKYVSKAAGLIGYAVQYGCWTHCTFEYIGDFVICSGPSMEPTLYSNNILVTERFSPRMNTITRGDIVIAKNPSNPKQFICKRVIGLPGDKVITQSAVQINPFAKKSNSTNNNAIEPSISDMLITGGQHQHNFHPQNNNISENVNQQSGGGGVQMVDALNNTAVGEENTNLDNSSLTQRMFKSNTIIIPRGHVWVEGDNVENSSDSRHYGPIPFGLIKSRAFCRLWPPQDIGLL